MSRASLVFVFFGPPSWPVIEQRLRGRGTDPEEVIQHRLHNARHELASWREYDYLIVNDVVEQAAAQLAAVRAAAHCATIRCGAPWTRD
jgi:guanylate kinase